MSARDEELPELPQRLAGAELRLTAPGRVSQVYAVIMALDSIAKDRRAVKPTHLVLIAALGLCWARVRSRLPFGGDVLVYGEQVIDLLLDPTIKLGPNDRPATMLDLVQAGRHAVVVLQASVPTQTDVQRAEGFTGPRSEDSSAND